MRGLLVKLISCSESGSLFARFVPKRQHMVFAPSLSLWSATWDGQETETELAEEGEEGEQFGEEELQYSVPESKEEILNDQSLLHILAKYTGDTETAPDAENRILDPEQLRVDILAHLRTSYDVLFPSNVFPTLRTVGNAADFVISELHPPKSLYQRVKENAPSNLIMNVKEHKPARGVKVDRPRSAEQSLADRRKAERMKNRMQAGDD